MAGNVAADLVVHVGSDVQGAMSGLNQVDNKVTGLGSKFQIAGGMFLGAGTALAGGLGLSISTAANFEQAMANIGAVTGLSGAELDKYGDLALEIGSKTSFGATEGAMAIEELAKAGLPMEDILNGAAFGAANLAEAGGIGMADAATTMSNAMNMFKIAGSDATLVADVFAGAANASAADVGDLSMALAQGGPAAAAFGMSLDETVGALALFSNYGIKGSDAGTSLKTMLTSLASPSAEAAAEMERLGINAFDAQGNFIGMEALAGQLQTSLSGLTQEERNAALALIFGSDAQRVANILYEEGAAGVANMNKAIAESPKASEMAATRLNTLKGSIESLKGAFETAMIIVGSMFIPAIRAVADSIGGAVVAFSELSPNVQKFIGIGVAVAAAFFLIVGAVMLLSGYLLPMVGAFTAVAAPILLVAAALGALYLAYKTNFLGFADGVNAAISGLMGVVKPFFNLIRAAATGDVMALGNAFKTIPGPLKAFAALLAQTITAARAFFQVMGKDGIGAAFAALPRLLATVKPFFDNFIATTLGQLRNIPWGTMFEGILDASKDLGKMATKLFKKVPWAKYAKAGLKGLKDFGNWIADAAGDAGDTLGRWWQDNVAGIDWQGPLRAGLSRIGNLWSAIQPRLAAIPGQFIAWYKGWLNSVPWNDLGRLAGEAVRAMAILIGQGLAAIGSYLVDNWKTVLTVITGLFLGLPAAIGYLGTLMLPKALEFLQGFAEGLGINWPVIGEWLQGLPARILSGLASLASTLAPKALELIRGLWQGLQDNWPMISAWLGEIGGKALTAVGSLLLVLAGRGLELITSLYNGLVNNWPTIVAWLGEVGGMAFRAIGSLLLTLAGRGLELITSLYNGLINNWPTISAWLGMVGAMAFTAIGSLLLTLAGRGLELITSLYQGLINNWPTIVTWLGQVGAMVFTAVGSLLLTLAGRALELITGLYQGLITNWPTISAWLGNVGLMAVTAVGSLLLTLAGRALELITGLYQGLITNWPTISAWLGQVGMMAVAAVGSLLLTLVSRGLELITGLYNALINNWPTISSWLGEVGNMAFAAVGSLLQTLLARGIEMITGLFQGAGNYWRGTVVPWLNDVGDKAFTAVGSLLKTLLSRGVDLLRGLWDGVFMYWTNTLKPWLSGLGGKAVGAVGSLLGSLWDAGWDLMMGFKSGISAGWENVKDFLGSLNPADWKGPPRRDRKMLIENGELTMAGYREGLNNGWLKTQSQLRAYTKVISKAGMVTPRTQYKTGQKFMQNLGLGMKSEFAKIDKMMQSFSESLSVSSPWLVPLAQDIWTPPGAELPRGGVSVEQGKVMPSSTTQNTTIQHIQVDVRVDELEDMVRAGNFVKTLNSSRKLYG